IVEAAQELVRQGAKAVTSDCGYFGAYQREVADAVPVPVFLSSLMQAPLVLSTLGPSRKLAVLVANGASLSERVLERIGILDTSRIVFRGLEDKTEFRRTVLDECGTLDVDAVEREVVDAALEVQGEHPEVGAVADTWAFVADDPGEFHSAQHTRVHVGRLFPQAGEHFVTNTRRPILLLEEDATPGIHDMLCAACDPARYAGLGVDGWHASCEENLQTALRAVGVEPPRFAPQPINLFMNTPARADGTIDWLPAP